MKIENFFYYRNRMEGDIFLCFFFLRRKSRSFQKAIYIMGWFHDNHDRWDDYIGKKIHDHNDHNDSYREDSIDFEEMYKRYSGDGSDHRLA